MTFQTISGNGRLAELAGLRRVASVRKVDGEFPLHTYYRVTRTNGAWSALAGVLRSFQGSYEAVEPLAGTRVPGNVLGFDLNRRSDKHILQVTWPGAPIAPLATERRVDQGKVVYIAPDLCAAARRYGDADSLAILAAAVRAASSNPLPIVVENVPPSVEVTAHRGRRGLAVVLVNQTCNQYLADPVRYIVPIQGARLTLDCGPKEVRSVRTVTGADCHWRQVDDRLHLTLPKLGDYEGILVEQ
jgi:hypothetical protein